jgi:hypothetical protein
MKLRLAFYDKKIHNTREIINFPDIPKQSEKRKNGITIYYKFL